jgi:hypothetical protein
MLIVIVVVVTSILVIEAETARHLEVVNDRLKTLVDKCTIEVYDHACVDRAQYSDGTQNALHPSVVAVSEVPGTTIWINEWMAPGHMEYDLQFLEVLHSTDVDRIILQRAPCFRPDFCEGITYWNSFFKGIYTAALLSAKRDIPVYFRFHPHEPAWQPHMLSRGDIIGDPSTYPNISVTPTICFNKLIRRAYSGNCYAPCNGNLGLCFAKALTPDTATKFKAGAYSLLTVSPSSISLLDAPKDRKKIITLAHRSGIKRGMADPQKLAEAIKSHYASNDNIVVRLHDTRNSSVTYLEQVELMATSEVVLCTHGAFVGNIVYMRDNSLLLELSGSYDNYLNALPFEELAKVFKVKRVTTTIADLKSQEKVNYVISDEETSAILQIIGSYLSGS